MAGSFAGELYSTIGVEFEGIGLEKESFIPRELLRYLQLNYGDVGKWLNVTHDASTEFYASTVRTPLGGILVSKHTPEMEDMFSQYIVQSQVMGYELVTHPLTIARLESLMYPMVTSLQNLGDFISDRAALHFHVGCGNNLRILKALLRISLMVDPVLFRLGGMGRTFRGHMNHAAYARPLLHSIAVNVSTSNSANRYAKIINPLAALEANSMEEFWGAFGVKYRYGGGSQKYHPSRYCGINFYSIPQHGTLEFRHFNQTHNVPLIMSIAKFVRGLVELGSMITKGEMHKFEIVPSDVEISMSDASMIVEKLIGLCHDKEVEDLPSDYELELMMKVLSESHFEKLPEMPVLTHIHDDTATLSMEAVNLGRLETFAKVLPSQYVDIHTISYRSIYDVEKPQINSTEAIPTINLQEASVLFSNATLNLSNAWAEIPNSDTEEEVPDDWDEDMENEDDDDE